VHNTYNILYLNFLPNGPSLFLHIPYLIIRSSRQSSSQLEQEQISLSDPSLEIEIILYNDELINKKYISPLTTNRGLNDFYTDIIKNYQQVVLIFINEKLKTTGYEKLRIIIYNVFLNYNFLIKIYLFIHYITSTRNQVKIKSVVDCIITDELKSHLNDIFKNIDFSKLVEFNLEPILEYYPPEPLPPYIDISILSEQISDIHPNTLRLLCPYRLPILNYTPDKYLSLLISPVYP
jgi:hypothetical protein